MGDLNAEIDARFVYLRTLDPNWDSYGALRLQPDVENRARAILATLATPPFICMTVDGGISLEWDNEQISVEVKPDGGITAWLEEHHLAVDDD